MPQRLILHIGLHKTGTTYLQESVWQLWEDVGYAGRPTPKGFRTSEEAVFSLTQPVLLMSNESSGGSLKQSYLPGKTWSGLQLAKLQELRELYAGKYELGVFIGLRKPAAWALSIYKHYLKYGGVETFEGFLGLVPGTPATLEPEDFQFMPKIRRIEEVLGVAPFCFFLEEMRSQPEVLSQAMAAYAGVAHGPQFVAGEALNEGVNEAEAEICRKLNRAWINRGCLGKGWIRRNKTTAFALARKSKDLGLLRGSTEPLGIPPQAREFLAQNSAGDMASMLEFMTTQRGIAAGSLAGALGLTD